MDAGCVPPISTLVAMSSVRKSSPRREQRDWSRMTPYLRIQSDAMLPIECCNRWTQSTSMRGTTRPFTPILYSIIHSIPYSILSSIPFDSYFSLPAAWHACGVCLPPALQCKCGRPFPSTSNYSTVEAGRQSGS